MELPSKIDGPTSMYIYHLGGDINKLVIMLGDRHNLPMYGCGTCTEDCQRLPEFLKETFKKSKTCIDFFIETPFISKETPSVKFDSSKILMSQIRREFEDCLWKTKDECAKYGNVRMHYSDIRQSGTTNLIEFIGYLHPTIYRDLLKFYRSKCVSRLTEDQKKTLDRMFFNLNINKTTEIIEYVIGLRNKLPPNSEVHDIADETREFQRKKIAKQLKVLPEYMKEVILEHHSRIISSFIKDQIINLKAKLLHIIMRGVCNSSAKLQLFVSMLGVIADPIMDVYLLARLLKPSLSDSRVAIVYAGSYHINLYDEFFRKRDFAKRLWSQPTKHPIVKCIKIPKDIILEVKKITEKYPIGKCSTKKLLRNAENEIAKIYDVTPEQVHKCLQETSKVHLEPLWKVTGIVLHS